MVRCNGIVYVATLPDGAQYVGSARGPAGTGADKLCRARRSRHYTDARRGSTTAFHRAIRDHGFDGIAFDVVAFLQRTSVRALLSAEKDHIDRRGGIASAAARGC